MKFYRYDTVTVGGYDPYEETSTCSYQKLVLNEFTLVKETVKCYRILHMYGFNTKLIRKKSRKKFAYLTKEDAAESFFARKTSQVRILEEQLKRAKSALNIAKNLNDEMNKTTN